MADEDIKQKEPTRRDLADELAQTREINARLLERLEALEAKHAAPTVSVQEAILQRELSLAQAELADKRALLERAALRPSGAGPDIPLVPYKGLVIALAPCCIGTWRAKDEIFEVDLPALYTDDPFEPVSVTEWDAVGAPVKWVPNQAAPTPINFRFRRVISAAEDPTPRRANEY